MRMARSREVVNNRFERGEKVYGLTTGVGVLKKETWVAGREGGHADRRLLEFHRISQGPRYPNEVVRAAAVRLANHFAMGVVGVRPELAERVVASLNNGADPNVPMLGENLVVMPALALGYIGDMELAAGEGLALLSNTAILNGHAALILDDLSRLVAAMDVAIAMSYEAFRCKITQVHEGAIRLRRQEGVARSAERIRSLLDRSALWDTSNARNLQDPISFRCAAHIQGAIYDAMAYTTDLLERELNSSQNNPVILAETDEVVAIGNWEVQSMMAALDFLRLSLATPLTASQERSIKLLDKAWSGLPTGLVSKEGSGDSGLAMYQILVGALAAEARLLAPPVSNEVTSTTGAEGIEDRWNFGLLSCRRLDEMVRLGELIVAVELLVAAEAMELRGLDGMGSGARAAFDAVRSVVPAAFRGGPLPSDLSPLTALIRQGGLP
jgi:histidine ammonia-lyase